MVAASEAAGMSARKERRVVERLIREVQRARDFKGVGRKRGTARLKASLAQNGLPPAGRERCAVTFLDATAALVFSSELSSDPLAMRRTIGSTNQRSEN